MKLLNMAAHICLHVTIYVVPLNLICNTVLDSSKSVNTSPAATVYICQRSSKLPDELFIQCAPWETVSYINKQWWN